MYKSPAICHYNEGMEDKIITTPNGYKVYIKPFLTHTQFVQIQKLYTKDIKIDPNKKKDASEANEEIKLSEFPANLVYDAQDLTVSFLVRKIEDKDGSVVERSGSDLPIPVEDGQAVMEVITEISNQAAAAFDKKKLMTSPK